MVQNDISPAASVTELRRVVGLNVSGIILTWALLMGGGGRGGRDDTVACSGGKNSSSPPLVLIGTLEICRVPFPTECESD